MRWKGPKSSTTKMARKGSNFPPCRVEGCRNEVVYVTLDLCAACYQRMLYWSHRSPKEQIRRVDNLRRWEASMTLVLGNVKPIRGSSRR